MKKCVGNLWECNPLNAHNPLSAILLVYNTIWMIIYGATKLVPLHSKHEPSLNVPCVASKQILEKIYQISNYI